MKKKKDKEKVLKPWGKERNPILGNHCGDPDCWHCEPYTETKNGVSIYYPGKPAPKEWK